VDFITVDFQCIKSVFGDRKTFHFLMLKKGKKEAVRRGERRESREAFFAFCFVFVLICLSVEKGIFLLLHFESKLNFCLPQHSYSRHKLHALSCWLNIDFG
jgi:hypothetical protein